MMASNPCGLPGLIRDGLHYVHGQCIEAGDDLWDYVYEQWSYIDFFLVTLQRF